MQDNERSVKSDGIAIAARNPSSDRMKHHSEIIFERVTIKIKCFIRMVDDRARALLVRSRGTGTGLSTGKQLRESNH